MKFIILLSTLVLLIGCVNDSPLKVCESKHLDIPDLVVKGRTDYDVSYLLDHIKTLRLIINNHNLEK